MTFVPFMWPLLAPATETVPTAGVAFVATAGVVTVAAGGVVLTAAGTSEEAGVSVVAFGAAYCLGA